jgi:hypothetical protein
MASRHRPRRSHISGIEGVRARARRVARTRTHDDFTRLLSGYDGAGAPIGPYTGTKLLDEQERHTANEDENRPDFAGSFSKGLEHDPTTGFVRPDRYDAFRRAVTTVVNAARLDPTLPDPASVETIDNDIVRAPDNRRAYVNPLSGVDTDLNTVDPLDVGIPKAPAFDSDIAGLEMVELYWMALMRDQWFDKWAVSGDAKKLADAAVAELDKLNKQYEPFALYYEGFEKWSRDITLERLFRGSALGNDTGPYVSQFLVRDVPFGTIDFEQKQFLLQKPTTDYMTTPTDWRKVQDGAGNPNFPAAVEPKRSDLEQVAADTSGNPLPLQQHRAAK